jgi:hypothetical protein
MKLSDIKGERALDVLADMIEPVSEILGDKEIAGILQAGKAPAKAIKLALKNHKRAVLDMMAAIDGEDPKTYQPSIFVLPKRLLDLLNDPEVQRLFSSQETTSDEIS